MKNQSIQGLRGIAALMVFFSHALSLPDIPSVLPLKNSFFHLVFDGQVAVMLFIAISGFFYYNKESLTISRYCNSLKRKFIRVCLPYFIVMTIGCLLCNYRFDYNESLFSNWGNSFWHNDISFTEYLKQISILWPHDTHLLNPPTWYIPIEVRFFLLMPILVMANNYKYTKWWVCLIFILLMFIGKGQWYGACLLGYFSRILFDYFSKNKGRWKYTKVTNIILTIVSIALLNIQNEVPRVSENIAFSAQAFGAAILVCIIFYNRESFLSNKICVWFGNISYEFYLIHFLILLYFRSFFFGATFYILTSLVISVISAKFLNAFCLYITKSLRK